MRIKNYTEDPYKLAAIPWITVSFVGYVGTIILIHGLLKHKS